MKDGNSDDENGMKGNGDVNPGHGQGTEAEINQKRVLDAIDNRIVEEVEVVPEPDTLFNISMNVGGMGVHVVREDDDAPVLTVGVMVIDDQLLDTFRDLSESQRMNFLSQIGAVLTNSPGLYRFTDTEGNDVPYNELEAVRVEHRLYPDGFSQNALMNSVFDVVPYSLQRTLKRAAWAVALLVSMGFVLAPIYWMFA
ncbi:MAG: DUF2299 family protein, partial [Halobacteria archaeon]|nr:DUF2299 family protein [Halobacteria archaeon]